MHSIFWKTLMALKPWGSKCGPNLKWVPNKEHTELLKLDLQWELLWGIRQGIKGSTGAAGLTTHWFNNKPLGCGSSYWICYFSIDQQIPLFAMDSAYRYGFEVFWGRFPCESWKHWCQREMSHIKIFWESRNYDVVIKQALSAWSNWQEAHAWKPWLFV